ncbi:undecaprenyl-diphosphate phosphatase [Nocardioidaceae bacterium]|nr:undecaprenyl-diphosphate phosphatase [Nocardioidaceae bacterium]
MDYLQAIVLGTLQGLTEFLPISSSAHLRIFPELFGWGDPGAAFTAVTQIGTEVAVLLYFRKDIWNIATTWTQSLWKPELRGDLNARMGWYVIIGSLPIVILGLLLQDVIRDQFRSLWIVGTTLIVFGIVLGIADRVGSTEKTAKDLTWRHAVLYGLAQAAALVPGVSRSGGTISMGRFLGYDRAAATRFAFLLAIPAVIGAGVFELKSVLECNAGSAAEECVNAYTNGQTLAATVVAFAVGYVVIAALLRYLQSNTFSPFVIYRIILGSGVLVLLSAGVLAA